MLFRNETYPYSVNVCSINRCVSCSSWPNALFSRSCDLINRSNLSPQECSGSASYLTVTSEKNYVIDNSFSEIYLQTDKFQQFPKKMTMILNPCECTTLQHRNRLLRWWRKFKFQKLIEINVSTNQLVYYLADDAPALPGCPPCCQSWSSHDSNWIKTVKSENELPHNFFFNTIFRALAI